MLPLILGGLAIAAVIAFATSKSDSKPSGTGETWHYVFAVYPEIPGEDEFKKLSDTLQYLTPDGQLVDVDYPQKNTIEVTARYPGKARQITKGQIVKLGPYSLTLTEADRIS